jgi:hypothetical protein
MDSEPPLLDRITSAGSLHLPEAPSEVWDVACYGEPMAEAAGAPITAPGDDEAAPMPAPVQLAILFECAAVALQGVDVVVSNQLRPGGLFGLRVACFVAVAVGVGLLMYLVSTRRAWARLVVLNLTIAAGFVLLPVVALAVVDRSPAGLAVIALYLLHAAAVAFLFLPRTSAWFARA